MWNHCVVLMKIFKFLKMCLQLIIGLGSISPFDGQIISLMLSNLNIHQNTERGLSWARCSHYCKNICKSL